MMSTRLSTRVLALVSALVLLLALGAGGAGAAKQRAHRALDGTLPPGAINNEYYASLGLFPPSGYHCEHYQGGVGPVPSGTTVGADCTLRGLPNSGYGDFYFGVAFIPDAHPLDQTGAIFAGNYHVFIEFIQWVPPTLDGTAKRMVGLPA